MPEGEVRVISASSGKADGFPAVLPRPQAVLDMFRAPIYASSRWLDGIIEAKPSPRAGAAEKQIPIKTNPYKEEKTFVVHLQSLRFETIKAARAPRLSILLKGQIEPGEVKDAKANCQVK
jgi:hypothetical protein